MEKLPHSFRHIYQDRSMLEVISDSLCVVVGEPHALGRRMSFGPCCVEYYTGDTEPVLAPYRGLRFVIWNRVLRNDIPESWSLIPFESLRSVSALLDMRKVDDYSALWNGTHKTYRNHFCLQKEYYISEVSANEFCLAYKKYANPIIQIEKNIRYIKKLASLDTDNLHCYVLKKVGTEEIVSGFVGADFFSVSQSYYFSAFTRKDIAPKESGVWLINFWMSESSKKGIQFANLGPIWTEGQPDSWKGFTTFKLKFKPILLLLPKELIRFTFSLTHRK